MAWNHHGVGAEPPGRRAARVRPARRAGSDGSDHEPLWSARRGAAIRGGRGEGQEDDMAVAVWVVPDGARVRLTDRGCVSDVERGARRERILASVSV